MSALVDTTPQPFSLDAILQEFNVDQPAKATDDDLTIARVRESLGLGQSLFRRKHTPPQDIDESTKNDEVMREPSPDGDTEIQEKPSKPRRRILDSDDDSDDEIPPVRSTSIRSSSPTSSNKDSDDDNQSLQDVSSPDSDDEFSTLNLLAGFRKARLEALSAKVATKTRTEEEDTESAPSERSASLIQSVSQSPVTTGRKTKTRKASKKALDDMQRETQRMARNMGLRPEIKTSKTIEMSAIFAKFGFVPNKPAMAETPVDDTIQSEQVIEQSGEARPDRPDPPQESSPAIIAPQTPTPPPGDVETTDWDSDESLPSPSKLLKPLAWNKKNNPQPKNSPTPRKVHFTLRPASSSSESDSDVEILPPPSRLSTHLATPDRKRLKRSTLIRTLANIKSPVQTRSPGRMTQKELDATLSREAAVQTAQKREERRAELKKLGIDVEKVVEKRDLLEEAREEARRIREEEGGEESDDEYVEGDENDADIDDDSGDDAMESGEDEEEAEEESENEEMEESDDEISDDAPPRRKARAVIISDDEDDNLQGTITGSTIGSQPNITTLGGLPPADDVSLTQFFKPTQMSGSTETTTQTAKESSQPDGTGLTQFFVSTAMEENSPLSGDDAAHNRMDHLRYKAAQGIVDLGDETIGFPGVERPVFPSSLPESHHSDATDPEESPIRRRILKRHRRKTKEKPLEATEETSEEFKKSRKEFIEEQAEESEDDYAAWGSGDESENENMDGVVEGLIDDDTKVKKNAEREVARLYMYYI